MIILYFIIVVFLGLFARSIIQKQVWLMFLLFIYLVSFVATIFLNNLLPQNNIEVYPTLYLLTILFLWFAPFSGINTDQVDTIYYKRKKLQGAMLFTGIPCSIATIFFGFFAIKLFTTENLIGMRDQILRNAYLPEGIFTAILIIISTAYFINIFLFFVALKDGFNRLYPSILFFASLSFPLMVLCFFGRDGVFYWTANFLLMFLWFRRSLPRKLLRETRKKSYFLIILFLGIFIFITVSRFSKSGNFLLSIFSYLGQQVQNFSDSFHIEMKSYTLLPGLERLLIKLGIMQEMNMEMITKMRKTLAGSEFNVFGFFVKDFIWSIGKIPTLLLSVVAAVFAHNLKVKFKRSQKLEDAILLLTIFQIPMNGVFYYRQSVSYMDVGLLVAVLIYFYFKIKINPLHTTNNLNPVG